MDVANTKLNINIQPTCVLYSKKKYIIQDDAQFKQYQIEKKCCQSLV